MSERIAHITLDGESAKHRSMEVQHERQVALTDLMHENNFSLVDDPCGPYEVTLKIEESRLVFAVRGEGKGEEKRVGLPMQPLRGVIRDYFLMCESYYAALKEAKPHKLEAIDMGRRGVHNDGAEALNTLLKDKITVDFSTARRLFTLICVLHLK